MTAGLRKSGAGKFKVKLVAGWIVAHTDRAVLLDCHRDCWVPTKCVIAKRPTCDDGVMVFSITPFDRRNNFKAWKKLKALQPDELQRLLKK